MKYKERSKEKNLSTFYKKKPKKKRFSILEIENIYNYVISTLKEHFLLVYLFMNLGSHTISSFFYAKKIYLGAKIRWKNNIRKNSVTTSDANLVITQPTIKIEIRSWKIKIGLIGVWYNGNLPQDTNIIWMSRMMSRNQLIFDSQIQVI